MNPNDPKSMSPHGDKMGDKNTHVPMRGGYVPMSTPETPLRGFSGGGDIVGTLTPPPVPPCGSVGTQRGHSGDIGKKPRRKKAPKPELVILEDTREQTPFTSWEEGVAVERATLETGDYSVKGWEHCFCIERKSLEDLAGTMMGGYEANSQRPRKRFNNELERMRHFDFAAIVVTATPEEVLNFRHHCGMDAHGALWGFCLSIQATYGVPVYLLGNEKTAAKFVADIAKKYVAVREKKNRTREERQKKERAAWNF